MERREVGCGHREWLDAIERRGVGWGEDVKYGQIQGEDDAPWGVGDNVVTPRP